MNSRKLNSALSVALFFIWGVGCAHAPPSRSVSHAPSDLALDPTQVTLVDITYSLERSQYRMKVENAQAIHAEGSLDGQKVREAKVTPEGFAAFVAQLSQFVSGKTSRNPAQTAPPCHGPYKVKIMSAGKTQELQGCRSTDNGALSRLVREGEVLLYSKN